MKGNRRVRIKGVECNLELAAWTCESEKAGKFLSLSTTPAAPRDEHSRRSAGRPQDEDTDPAW